MIRQAISCDICGTEMQNANHWFVAYDHGPELRLGAWEARNRLRAGARHLCGQTCLHKLVDEFMAAALNLRTSPSSEKSSNKKTNPLAKPARRDTSLTSVAAHPAPARISIATGCDEHESATPSLVLREVERGAPSTVVPQELVPPSTPVPAARIPTASARNIRAEAWKREREREQRDAQKQRPSIAVRRSIA